MVLTEDNEQRWFPHKMASWLGVSIQTVHNWTDKYKALLSEEAQSTGEGRQYDKADCVILWTVKAMRDKKLSHGEILSRLLDQGERVIPTSTPDTMVEKIEPKSLTEVDILRSKLAQREEELLRLRANNDELKDQITALQGEINALERVIDKLAGK